MLSLAATDKVKTGFIRARRNTDFDVTLGIIRRLVIKRDPFSHVSCTYADNRICSLIIVGAPTKDFYTDYAFSQ
jgi:hypothetical protein